MVIIEGNLENSDWIKSLPGYQKELDLRYKRGNDEVKEGTKEVVTVLLVEIIR